MTLMVTPGYEGSELQTNRATKDIKINYEGKRKTILVTSK